MKKMSVIFFILFCYFTLFVFKVSAATESATPSALPETGIITPLLIISGAGVALIGSGKFLKSLK